MTNSIVAQHNNPRNEHTQRITYPQTKVVHHQTAMACLVNIFHTKKQIKKTGADDPIRRDDLQEEGTYV